MDTLEPTLNDMHLSVADSMERGTYYSTAFYGMDVDTMITTPLDAEDDEMETGVVLHSRRASRDLTLEVDSFAHSPVTPFHTRGISQSSSFLGNGDVGFLTSPVDEDADNEAEAWSVDEQVSPGVLMEPSHFDPTVVTPSRFSPISTQMEPRKRPKRSQSKQKDPPSPNALDVTMRLNSGHRHTKRPSDFEDSSPSASPQAQKKKANRNPFPPHGQVPIENDDQFSMPGFTHVEHLDASSASSIHSDSDSESVHGRIGLTSDINILYASDNSPRDAASPPGYDAMLDNAVLKRRLVAAKSSHKITEDESEPEDEDDELEELEMPQEDVMVSTTSTRIPKGSSTSSHVTFDNEAIPFLGRIASIDENVAATPGYQADSPDNRRPTSVHKDISMVPSPYVVETTVDERFVDYGPDMITSTPPASLPVTDNEFLSQLPSLSLQLIQRSEGASLKQRDKAQSQQTTPGERMYRLTPKENSEKYHIVDSDNDEENDLVDDPFGIVDDPAASSAGSSTKKTHRTGPGALSLDSRTSYDPALTAFDSRSNSTRRGIITINTPHEMTAMSGSVDSGRNTPIQRSPRDENPPAISHPPPSIKMPSRLPEIPQGTSRSRYDTGGGSSPLPPVVERRASAGPLRKAATMSNLRLKTPSKRKNKGKKDGSSSARSPQRRRSPESADEEPKFPPQGRVRRAKSNIIPKGLKIFNPDAAERTQALERLVTTYKERSRRLEAENNKFRSFCIDLGFDPDALPNSPVPLANRLSKLEQFNKNEMEARTPASIITSVTTDEPTPNDRMMVGLSFGLRQLKAAKSASTSASNSKSDVIGRHSGAHSGGFDDIQSSLFSAVTQEDFSVETRRMKDQIAALKRELDETKMHVGSYENQLTDLHTQLKSTRQANMILAAEREQDGQKLQKAVADKLHWEAMFDKARQTKSQLADACSKHIFSLKKKLADYEGRETLE